MRGDGRNAEARAQLGGGLVGHRDCPRRGNNAALRGRAPAPAGGSHQGPHPLAEPPLVNAVADRVDHACPVMVRDLEPVDRARRSSAAGFPVGRVDAGVLDPDPDLAGPRLGRGDVLDPQHLAARAVLVIKRSSHALAAWTSRSGSAPLSPDHRTAPECGRGIPAASTPGQAPNSGKLLSKSKATWTFA